MPYISVIVPVYNSEETIERCVESICRQNFQDIEVLLIDDGSTDKSAELCDRLATRDGRIQVIHKENRGVSHARNTGLETAEGRYILFVDSDDYLPEYYCEKLVITQKEMGESVFCWTSLQIISENHKVEERMFVYEDVERSVAKRSDVLKFSARYLLNSPVNKLYHSDIIKKYKLRMDEEVSIAEDLLFNLHYLDALGECQVVILNQVPYYYVRNGQISLDCGYKNNYYDIHKKVLWSLWEYCKKWRVPTEDIPLFYKRYWEYMQNAFANLEYHNCPLSGFGKFVEKSRITADRHFQKSLVQQKGTLGRGSYLMWRSRIYLLVWLYEKFWVKGKYRN